MMGGSTFSFIRSARTATRRAGRRPAGLLDRAFVADERQKLTAGGLCGFKADDVARAAHDELHGQVILGNPVLVRDHAKQGLACGLRDVVKDGVDARPAVASQLIREYIYLYGAVVPKDGTCVYLIMPTSNTACFQAFLDMLARKFARQDILLVLDGAPNHRCGELALPRQHLAALPAALCAGTQSKRKSLG